MRTDDLRPVATAARLLYEAATSLVRQGARSDDVLSSDVSVIPRGLAAAVRRVAPLPDRTQGWRVVPGLLGSFPEPGPTPPHWQAAAGIDRSDLIDMGILLAAASLGQVFGFRGQQDGHLVHNLVPSHGSETLQVGASSSVRLHWHTEDAFHPQRAELLVLCCVRNRDLVGSEVASVRRAELTSEQVQVLEEPLCAILPDDSYPTDWRKTPITGMPTVWRTDEGLCLRYDPSYTRRLTNSPAFDSAYEALEAALDKCGGSAPIAPGDVLLIDNDVAVHGRRPFQARFDGTDRWLKRVLVHLPRVRPAHERQETGYGQHQILGGSLPC